MNAEAPHTLKTVIESCDPVLLPPVTFLCGSGDRGALTHLLAEEDADLLPRNLLDPLYTCVQELFFDGYNPNYEVVKRLAEPILGGDSLTAGDFLRSFEQFMRQNVAWDILGRIALRDLQGSGYLDVFSRVIYPDLEDPQDTVPFVKAFGAPKCLVIQTGTLTTLNCPCRTLWVPMLDPPLQLSYVRRELENLSGLSGV